MQYGVCKLDRAEYKRWYGSFKSFSEGNSSFLSSLKIVYRISSLTWSFSELLSGFEFEKKMLFSFEIRMKFKLEFKASSNSNMKQTVVGVPAPNPLI